jgi:Putative peptidoglycan binding domain
MNPTLRYGSRGESVAKLQSGLNLLPSKLPKLAQDGVYGGKTTSRVQEFQRDRKLTPDGITGPGTWQAFLDLLAQVQPGGLPALPSAGPADPRRPLVLMIAQKHFGVVDFQQMVGGRPKGVDFLIEMFKVAAGVTLTDANFRNPDTGAWSQEPWISSPKEPRKSWCGIFCVYCYKKAGFNVSWDLSAGKPAGQIQLNGFSTSFAANIRQADIGCVDTRNHHFLIESVNGPGPVPGVTSIDGNQDWGRIERRTTHRVLKDNFNYYSIT